MATLDGYEEVSVLSKGGQGEVHLVKSSKEKGKLMVLKIFFKNDVESLKRELEVY